MSRSLVVGVMPAGIIAAALGLGVAAQSGPPDGAGVLVVVPPWRAADGVVARAGGVMLPQPRAALSVVAAGPGPDFAARLRAAGAWAVLPAGAVSLLCGG
ncbi:hypothetical protein [Rhodobaculum claviforme]|uniref:Uncharacterized protein n=1 Tax=Rhodobaculum claviforme TaxID=1549854 RepID=A0A934TJV9_9RHOB|nr:hypothetical protein [Rhodobaculum claviforme]MBK5927500.1 hypothetical protein [Rhodobaculum claviforme]